MTVCIAAICEVSSGANSPRIIQCADNLMSGALGKLNNGLKSRLLTQGWRALTAGSEDEITMVTRAAAAIFREARVKKRDIDETFVLTTMRDVLAARKKERADEFVRVRYGMSYDDVLTIGKERLPPEVLRDIMMAVHDIQLDVELLVTGYVPLGFPLIVEVCGRSGSVRIRENFASIGAGSLLATSVLLHRQYSEMMSLSEAQYCVFEAKKYAEGEISVGTTTTMLVATGPDGKIDILAPDGYDALSKKYVAYGPKPLPNDAKTWQFGGWTPVGY